MAGIYIHIPFCRKACHYCNFHFTTSLRYKDEMLCSIAREIELTAAFDMDAIETIYFGGGTPSLLSADELKKILDAVKGKFTVIPDAEITLEANPDDVKAAALAAWRTAGINRLSMGIQSFDEEELRWMNRAHTAKESLQCIDAIKAAGFTNFSTDLIYGSPLLTNDKWKRHVDMVIEKKVPHVSCYALTVEPRTPLAKKIAQHSKEDIHPDIQSEQFLLLMSWMRQAGYEHYEISNYALPGMRSQHNSSYWQGKKYYGFGPSAHSFDGNSRRWNIANNNLYIQSLHNNLIPFEEEKLTPTQHLNEYIMTALRTSEGLDLNKISTQFSEQHATCIRNTVGKYLYNKSLILKDERLVLTDEGKLFADGIAADLFS